MDTQWRLRESPHVATTLVPPLSIPCLRHHTQRGTVASYRLAAVFGTWPILHPASLCTTPGGGVGGWGAREPRPRHQLFLMGHLTLLALG